MNNTIPNFQKKEIEIPGINEFLISSIEPKPNVSFNISFNLLISNPLKDIKLSFPQNEIISSFDIETFDKFSLKLFLESNPLPPEKFLATLVYFFSLQPESYPINDDDFLQSKNIFKVNIEEEEVFAHLKKSDFGFWNIRAFKEKQFLKDYSYLRFFL